jgi:hypothetical protein
MVGGFHDRIVIMAAADHAVKPNEGDSLLFLSKKGKKVARITSKIEKIY